MLCFSPIHKISGLKNRLCVCVCVCLPAHAVEKAHDLAQMPFKVLLSFLAGPSFHGVNFSQSCSDMVEIRDQENAAFGAW